MPVARLSKNAKGARRKGSRPVPQVVITDKRPRSTCTTGSDPTQATVTVIKSGAATLKTHQLKVETHPVAAIASDCGTVSSHRLSRQSESSSDSDSLESNQKTRNLLLELVEQRTTELRGVQFFLNRADMLSGADIIDITLSLNDDILQAAAKIADLISTYEFRKGQNYGTNFPKRREEAEASSGSEIMETLHNYYSTPQCQLNEFRAAVLQIALQSCMVNFAVDFILKSRWSENKDTERVLADVYRNICEHGLWFKFSVET